MAAFSGVLVDVSGSMRCSIGDGRGAEGGKWVDSVIHVIDDIVTHDVSSDNRVFAIGVGAQFEDEIIDVIKTIEKTQEEYESTSHGSKNQAPKDKGNARNSTIQAILSILERNGATSVRKWANPSVISSAVTENRAQKILQHLQNDSDFVRKFVYECLPSACRNFDKSGLMGGFVSIGSSVTTCFVQAREGDIRDVVRQAKRYFAANTCTKAQLDVKMCRVSLDSVYRVHDAQNILHDCTDEEGLSTERSKDLLNMIEPYIYGSTPLYSAIREAKNLFLHYIGPYRDHRRLLFIVSDGMPTDDKSGFLDVLAQLKDAEVTIVSCYISNASNVQPRRLYDSSKPGWGEGAKFLFDISSTVATELVTRAIFIKRGWQIDIEKNETRLFLHANHPDHLKDVCELARNVVCCQDALSEVLVSVSLDIYINQQNKGFRARRQTGGTCYANASAAVLHLAMQRIRGRERGYPAFEEIRDSLVNRYGIEGANTVEVLIQVCPNYRLHSQSVSAKDAMKAIAAKRPVVAKFWLTDDEWDIFSHFFRRNPTGILTKRDLDISRRVSGASGGGHAVVLTSYNSQCLRLMNSWGENWADLGFFRVKNAEVLDLKFIDVYWTLNDLTRAEIDYYNHHGPEEARKLMTTLKGLEKGEFTCPSCHRSSKVIEFEGTLSHVKCPKCSCTFKSNDGNGNILALNVYLTSLSR